MFMNLKKFIVSGLVLSSFAFFGCGKAKEKVGKALDRDLDLVGTWKSPCEEIGVIDALPNATRTFEYGATGNFTRTEKFYLDDNCKQEAFVYEIEGTYQTKGASKENKNVDLINYTTDHVYVTIKSDEAIDALAALEICDINNWDKKLGEKVEITDKSCAGFNVKKGDVVVDVYQVKDESMVTGKALTFSMRDDSDDRPTEVDRSLTYSKR